MDRLAFALKYATILKARREGLDLPPKPLAKPKVDRTGRNAGFVYLIECHTYVKVGYATDVAARLAGLQTGCPYELRLLRAFKVPNMAACECKLHAMWQSYELRGEWFDVPSHEIISILKAKDFDAIFNA